jgi:hypothetical protein
MNKKKFVAFLDILGFNEIIENNSTDYIIKIYSEVLKSAYERSLGLLENQAQFQEKDSNIKSTIISDSILFWTEQDSSNGFIKLVITIDYFIYGALRSGFPIRGAIVYGDIAEMQSASIFNNSNQTSVILGNGITSAYKQEAKQDWLGCTVSQEAISRFEELSISKDITLSDLLEHGFLIKYNTPYKTGKIIEDYVINWPKVLQSKPEKQWVIDSFISHSKTFDVWEVQHKLNNTLAFLEYSWSFETTHAGNEL